MSGTLKNLVCKAQTVESTIKAYGAGEIELPEPERIDKTTRYAVKDKSICPYSAATVARFLGWQTFDKENPEGRPNHACNVAFQMLDAFELGIVSRKELRGVKRAYPTPRGDYKRGLTESRRAKNAANIAFFPRFKRAFFFYESPALTD